MSNEISKDQLKVVTTEFRVSHPHLFKATAMKEGQPKKYTIEMLFDKKTTDLSHLQKPVRLALTEKFGANKDNWPSPMRVPYADGDVAKLNKKTKKKEVKPEHKGMWVVKAGTLEQYGKPSVVGRDPSIKIEDESEIYPGCYARAALKASAYDTGENQGCTFILDHVQKTRDGVSLGSKKAANEVFGIIEGDAGEIETESFEAEEQEENFI